MSNPLSADELAEIKADYALIHGNEYADRIHRLLATIERLQRAKKSYQREAEINAEMTADRDAELDRARGLRALLFEGGGPDAFVAWMESYDNYVKAGGSDDQ